MSSSISAVQFSPRCLGFGENRQRGRKAIVTAAIENRRRAAGALRLGRVEDVSGEQLGGFVEGVVDPPRATVYTDARQGYYNGRRKAGLKE